tara:strand:- start:469 stop:720 length:252 start_codon:yes stop_codon:yes gene_type:complete
MISQSDLIMVVLAFLIGYLDDVTGPQKHHYENEIVIVDKKYQCPKHCAVHHHHSVYYSPESNGMVIEKELLGKKVKEKKKKRK